MADCRSCRHHEFTSPSTRGPVSALGCTILHGTARTQGAHTDPGAGHPDSMQTPTPTGGREGTHRSWAGACCHGPSGGEGVSRVPGALTESRVSAPGGPDASFGSVSEDWGWSSAGVLSSVELAEGKERLSDTLVPAARHGRLFPPSPSSLSALSECRP